MINPVYRSDVTVIIRTVGERTLDLCCHLVAQQVSEDHIFVISETPFSQAVKRTFEIGLEHNLPWTLAIDADILLRADAITELVRIAEQSSATTFEVQGQILDKLFGGPRPGGPHLFRTTLLSQALALIPADDSSGRPESYTIQQMAQRGNPWIQHHTILGLHDYEQYYHDLYRKAFVHAQKHRGLVLKQLEVLWQRLSQTDPDYQVASWGCRAGKIYDGELKIDIRHFPQEINALLQMQGWSEKGNLGLDAWSGATISAFIQSFAAPQEFRVMEGLLNGVAPATSWDTRFQVVLKKTGWSKLVPWTVGRGLKQIGHALQSWSEG